MGFKGERKVGGARLLCVLREPAVTFQKINGCRDVGMPPLSQTSFSKARSSAVSAETWGVINWLVVLSARVDVRANLSICFRQWSPLWGYTYTSTYFEIFHRIIGIYFPRQGLGWKLQGFLGRVEKMKCFYYLNFISLVGLFSNIFLGVIFNLKKIHIYSTLLEALALGCDSCLNPLLTNPHLLF